MIWDGLRLPGTLFVAVDGKQEDLEGHRGRRHVVVWVFGHGPQWLLWRERVLRHPRHRPRNCCAIVRYAVELEPRLWSDDVVFCECELTVNKPSYSNVLP